MTEQEVAQDVKDLDFTVHTCFGDFSARDYLIQIT